MTDSQTARKLTGGLVAVVVLAVCLCITTFALVWASVSIENDLFHTGSVEIDLNGGAPVIHENEFLFEPGMTVRKDFFIQNNSTCSVYYKLYVDNLSGGLADVLELCIQDGDTVLYRGTVCDLTRNGVSAADDVLQIGQKKTLTAVFYFPTDKGGAAGGADLTFTLCADATQTKNNPNRLFN